MWYTVSMKERIILHSDLNNFFASVESIFSPELKNVAMAVAGDPKQRHGVILAKNEIAKKLGVTTGEPVVSALKKAPNLVLVPPRHSLYAEYSNKVIEIYKRFTDRVESFGMDECWLDCTGSVFLFGDGKHIAETIKETVKAELGLTVSIGVSFNKIFAKLGSDMKKPDAVTEITKENFKQKIWNLPASEMFMVGKKTCLQLNKLNVFTIGDLAVANEKLLQFHFGINGSKMKKFAMGLDDEAVKRITVEREQLSIGHGMTATRDIRTMDDAKAFILRLADMVAARLRRHNLKAQGVKLDLRSSEFKHITKQAKLSFPTCTSSEIGQNACNLLAKIWKETPPLRTITVSAYDLLTEADGFQLSFLDFGRDEKKEKLEKALDSIRNKYGNEKIIRADFIENDFVYDVGDIESTLPFKRS